jgi:hypothetical protein
MVGFYRRWWRPLSASSIIGAAVWCAAGTVAVVAPDQVSPRVVAPAPWWVAFVAAALAFLTPGWRVRPLAAMPALLSIIPWVPVPVPVVALIWTGPLAWVPIGAALLVAEGGRVLAAFRRIPGIGTPARATALAALGALIVSLSAAWAMGPRVPGGDEPHYLVITQSLLQDADLQIENNHAARDYAAYFGGSIAPDFLVRGQNGAIYSIHAPGVSALVLPGFALLGLRGAQLTLILIFAVTGALVWRAAWGLTGDTSAAWFAWAAVVTSTTMAVLSFMVFPDAPGACAVAAGVWLLVSVKDAAPARLMAVSLLLATLPWLHTRFAVLAGLLGLAVVVLILTDRNRVIATRWRRLAWFVAIPIVSAGLWLWSFYAIYGTADPRVAYGPSPEIRSWIWGALAGLFVDQQFGLFTYAPVLAVGVAALFLKGPREWRTITAICVGSLMIYAMAVSSYWMWWAGVPGLPARFLTAAVPLLAVPLAVTWVRATTVGRAALLALLAISLAITTMVLAVDRGAMAWNPRHGQAAWLEWLSPVVNVPRMWPSFFWSGDAGFLRHALVLVVIAALVWLVLRAADRRASDEPDTRRLVVAGCLLSVPMVLAPQGWWLTDAPALDPARAQLRIHAAQGQGASVYQIGAGVGRWESARVPLQVHSDQGPLVDRPTSMLMTLVDVPAGAYTLRLSPAPPTTGEVTITIGRPPQPPIAVATGSETRFTLPGGATVLTVDAAAPEAARLLDAIVVPVSPAGATTGRARLFARFPNGEAFFQDDNVFAENEGFWVRGGRTAAVVLTEPSRIAGRARSLLLRNGGVPNKVTVRYGAWQEVVPLSAWQEQMLALPPSDAQGAWPLRITSASGFQPSATSGGTDTRYLGVWVQ